MDLKRRNGSRAIAALLLFSILQISLQAATPIPQQLVGRLTTRNNQPITVNGLSANTGASILSGATIETGADQSATVNLGRLGSLDLSPNTKVLLTFEPGNVKAMVAFGCVILKGEKEMTGEIVTEQGSVGKTDPAVGGVIEMCFQRGAAAPTVGPGVAAEAGAAGGGAGPIVRAAAGGGLFGLGRAATIAILSAAGAAALTPLFFQDNPSGSNP